MGGARWGAGRGPVGRGQCLQPSSWPQSQATGNVQSWVLTVTPGKLSLVLTSRPHPPPGEVSPSPYPMLPINITGRGTKPRVFHPVGGTV